MQEGQEATATEFTTHFQSTTKRRAKARDSFTIMDALGPWGRYCASGLTVYTRPSSWIILILANTLRESQWAIGTTLQNLLIAEPGGRMELLG